MVRYIHGSGDSTDLDVMYVFDEMPSFKACYDFCCADPGENRNIIVVRDGIVAECFKGIRDEVNNALRTTYPLHRQDYPLLIERSVPRDVYLKDITVTRKVMSPLTASPLRRQMKEALRGDWHQRIAALRELRLTEIDFDLVKKWNREDLLKSMAFQLGQGIGLHRGVELYTKADIAAEIPELRSYLYRQAEELRGLQTVCQTFADILIQTETEILPDNLVRFPDGSVYDPGREKRIV